MHGWWTKRINEKACHIGGVVEVERWKLTRCCKTKRRIGIMRQRRISRVYYNQYHNCEVCALASAATTCLLLQLLLVPTSLSTNGLVIFPSSIGFLGGRSVTVRVRQRAGRANSAQDDKQHFGEKSSSRMQRLLASVPKDVDRRSANWSKTANGSGGGSRSGARSRVKSVLEKARRRTKIDTSCEWESTSPTSSASTISNGASITKGGFEIFEEAVFENNGRLDYGTNISSSETNVLSNIRNSPSSSNDSQRFNRNGDNDQPSEIDLMRADTGAVGDASSVTVVRKKPLPFSLPVLSNEQEERLKAGERIQYQKDMGREGSGYVVLDVDAPSDVVWDCLLDFHSYPELIPTVREIKMFTNTHLDSDYRSENPIDYEDGTLATLKHGVPSTTRAAFTLSKFRLNIAAIHRYTPHPNGDYMIFTLDPACTNLVLQDAKGIWHTQDDPYGDGSGRTRVWLLCELKVSKILPIWITNYAAKRAMPRATSWLRPQVEAAAKLWLRKKL